MAHGVVSKVACQATTKTRHAFAQSDLETFLIVRYKIEWIALVGFNYLAIRHHFGFGLRAKSRGAQQSTGWQTDKAIAPKALATHD